MANTLQRAYNGADAFMLEKSDELHQLFLADMADFTAFDETLDNAFATAWLAKIESALGYKSDNTVLSEQKGQTITVEQAIANSLKAHKDILYFAEKALPKPSAVLQEMGKGKKLHSVVKSQAKFTEFMDEFKDIVDKHKAALLAVGCPQTTIDAVATAANTLRSLNTQQNLVIDGRPLVTEARVKELNAAYSPMLLVMNAAQLVYKNNPAKLEQYTYSPPVNHRPAHRLKIPVPAGATRELTATGIQPPLPENLQPLPHEKVRFSASGSSFTVYVTETPNGSLTEKQLQVAKGKIVSKTIQDILKLLKPGNEEKQLYAYIQNTGTAKGTLTITYYPEQE